MQRYTYIKTQVMKTIATLIFVLFIGVAAQAQTADEKLKVDALEMTVTFEEVSLESTIEVARLYKRIDTRVKKELTFTTKANRAKTV
jgi:UrcA family protein